MVLRRQLLWLAWLVAGCGTGSEKVEPQDGAGGAGAAGVAGTAGTPAGRGGASGGAGSSGTAGSRAGMAGASVGGAGAGGDVAAAGGARGGLGGAGGSGGAAGLAAGGTGGAAGAGLAGTGGGAGQSSGATGGSTGGEAGAGNGGRTAGGGAAGGGATEDVTVWLAGDSTMANGQTPCPTGWGKAFAGYFNDKVTVTNSAAGGRSIHTWLYNVGSTMDQAGECVLALDAEGNPTLQARWTQMLSGMQAGDFLFVQFGINDGDPSCDRHVGIEAFKESLGTMAAAAKQRGAQPIFLTPVSAVACSGSTPRGTRGGYVDATLEAGTEFDVPVIELHGLSVELYTERGFCPIPGGDVSTSTTGPVGDFFCDDHTHFSSSGADAIAGLVARALKDQGLPLAGYLK